jgi:hypothetical protein
MLYALIVVYTIVCNCHLQLPVLRYPLVVLLIVLRDAELHVTWHGPYILLDETATQMIDS